VLLEPNDLSKFKTIIKGAASTCNNVRINAYSIISVGLFIGFVIKVIDEELPGTFLAFYFSGVSFWAICIYLIVSKSRRLRPSVLLSILFVVTMNAGYYLTFFLLYGQFD